MLRLGRSPIARSGAKKPKQFPAHAAGRYDADERRERSFAGSRPALWLLPIFDCGDRAFAYGLIYGHLARKFLGHLFLQSHFGGSARNRHLVDLVLQLEQTVEEVLRTR